MTRSMSLTDVKIHGTYPFDGGRWTRLREVGPLEAAELAKLPEEFVTRAFVSFTASLPEAERHRICAKAKCACVYHAQDGIPCRHDVDLALRNEDLGYLRIYLWLNKGYILINAKKEGVGGLTAALLEGQSGEFGLPLKPGTQAVYLHDGRYSLIEVVQ
jgi:hypothetical protein